MVDSMLAPDGRHPGVDDVPIYATAVVVVAVMAMVVEPRGTIIDCCQVTRGRSDEDYSWRYNNRSSSSSGW